MLVILCIAIVLIAAVTTSVKAARGRTARRTTRDPMKQVFRRREFGRLDSHLEAVAQEERRRLEVELARYLAGRAGHVVVISPARNGVALELSDGRHLSLHGISPRMLERLNYCGLVDMLRPQSIDRDAFSYQLLFRGSRGTEIKIYARNIALTADRTGK